MTKKVTITINDWVFEYSPTLSGGLDLFGSVTIRSIYSGNEIEIPAETLLGFLFQLPIMQEADITRIIRALPPDDPFNRPITTTQEWTEAEEGRYQITFTAPDKPGLVQFDPPPLPGKWIKLDHQEELE